MDLNQFKLLEYGKLQNEISEIMSEIGKLERYAITSSGGIFAWLFVNNVLSKYILIVFLPAVLAFIFGFFALGYSLRLGKISRYLIANYENHLKTDEMQITGFGWESHLAKSVKKFGSFLFISRYFMWLMLVMVNIVIACWAMKNSG